MKTRIQSIHFDADKKLLFFIERKAEKLTQFSDDIIAVDVYLRLERVGDEANKIAEMHVIIPGNDLFAKEQCGTFEEATDRVVESLIRQINKQKEKQKFAFSTI
jgi:putative sigma-54 modulation protein